MPLILLDYLVVSGLCTASFLIFYLRRTSQSQLPYPPGPPRWPLVGSLFSLPKPDEMHDAITQWGKQYGTICQ